MAKSVFSHIKSLLDDAEYHLERGKTTNDPYELRLASHAIVDYYKALLNIAGEELKMEMPESYDPTRKFTRIMSKKRSLSGWKPLIKLTWSVRCKVDHSDKEAPKPDEIRHLIERAPEFKKDMRRVIKNHESLKKKKLTLKGEIGEYIKDVEFYLDANASIGYIKELHQFDKTLQEIEGLYPRSGLHKRTLSTALETLKLMLDELVRLNELAYRICPKCNGDVVGKTEEATQYAGPYDDPEPVSFSVFHVIKCERCEHEIEREHITTESI